MEGLPKDVVWLILRDVVADIDMETGLLHPLSPPEFFEKGLLFPSRGFIATVMCRLQLVCRMFQFVLRSKCKWTYSSCGTRCAGFIFKRGAFEGVASALKM